MAITNLTELRAAVTSFGLDRTDVTSDQIDNMIYLAEGDIVHGTFDAGGNMITQPLRVRSMETRDPAFALAGEYTTLPTGYLEMREVKFNYSDGTRPLKFITPEMFDETYTAANSGPATVWSVVGSQLRVGPGAANTDTCVLIYYKKPDALVASNTNWLLTNYPNVYLYGVLRHFAPFIGANEMLAVWQTAFSSSLRGLEMSEKRGSYSGTSMAVRSTGMTMP